MKLDENIFEFLNKNDLDLIEELDPSIDGTEILYEDDDFSKTPAEADQYRSETEDVLGFELNGNQVEYLATNWPEFYHHASKYQKMKDQIIEFMADEGLIDDSKYKNNLINNDIDDDIDDNFDSIESDDTLHPNINDNQNKSFTPMAVQSWDEKPAQDHSDDQFADLAAEQVEEDDFNTEDADILNKILGKTTKTAQ